MNQLINALYDLGCFATEDLVAWNAQIADANKEHPTPVEPFAIKPKTMRGILDLLQAIEEEYPRGE